MKHSNVAIACAVVIAFAAGCMTNYVPNHTTLVVNMPANSEITEAQTFAFEYPKEPTHSQAQLLGLAYDIAKKDGHEYPQILQGIILQESHAGTLKRYNVVGQEYGLTPTKRYYGVAQIKLSATWDVMKKWPALWSQFHFHTHTDDELIAKLIENDVFNMTVASRYLMILRDTYGFTTPAQLATAYNKGPGGAKDVDADTNEYALAMQVKLAAR